jgi:hypothetical protein
VISRSVPVLGTVLVLAIGPATALAGPGDEASTRSYARADLALVQYAAARLGTAETLLQGVLNKARADCPMAAAESPQNPESTMISNEIIGAMVLAAYHAARPEITVFVRDTSRLSWSNRALTRSVRAYASKLRTLSVLKAPDLCYDIRGWKASGYTKLPPATIAFNQRFVPAWVAIGEVPPQLFRYASGDARSTLRRASGLEAKLADFEAHAVQTYANIMNALGVSP